jgi:predicted RNA-binding protein with PUA-like domain
MVALVLKSEPSTYSFEDLVRERKTRWDGVKNPMAVKHMRAARAGDLGIFYHTGGERRAVGIVRIASDPKDDPKAPGQAVFEVTPLKPLVVPVTLDVIKATPAFRDSPLVKMGRLSVVPLSDAQWKAFLALGKTRV